MVVEKQRRECERANGAHIVAAALELHTWWIAAAMTSFLGHPPTVRLRLLRGFEVWLDDVLVDVPLSGQRVLAFLALHEPRVQRLYVAASLWLDSTEERANASLRTALWRLGPPSCRLVTVTTTHLALASGVTVDVLEAAARARDVLRRESKPTRPDLEALCLAGELLPDWYEDWVLMERERFRLLRLHALEALCEELTEAGDFAEAVDAGLSAVSAEPLRESAQRVLIQAYLAEGNVVDAIRQYRSFCALLRSQLGLEPSLRLRAVVGSLPIGDVAVTPLRAP
jgi:DNA-binding SARP family transcriptional activator